MSFDRIAPHYRWMERVLAGGKLQRCRCSFLDHVPVPQRILMAGEGHGRALVECRRRFSSAQVTYLDSSAGMHAAAHRALAASGVGVEAIEFVRADVLEWRPAAAVYDLVVTNFFLDCFGPLALDAVVQHLAGACRPNCDWLLADFQVAHGRFSGLRSRMILAVMYAFFRRVTALPAQTLSPPDPALLRAGFGLLVRREQDWGLLSSSWWRRGTAR